MYLIMHMFRLVKITVIEFPQIYSILSRGMNLIFLSYCIKYIKIMIPITKVKQLDFSYSLLGFSTTYVDRHQLLPN